MRRKIGIVLVVVACLSRLTACSAEVPSARETQTTVASTAQITVGTTEAVNTTGTPVTTQATTRQATAQPTAPAFTSFLELNRVNEIVVYQTERSWFSSYKAVTITDGDRINRFLAAVNTKGWADPKGYELATVGLYTVVLHSDTESRVLVYLGCDSEYGYVRCAVLPKEVSLPDTGQNREMQSTLDAAQLDFEEYIMPKKDFEESFEILFEKSFD